MGTAIGRITDAIAGKNATEYEIDNTSIHQITRHWLRQNELEAEGDLLMNLTNMISLYAIYFRLKPTEFFAVCDDGLTCTKRFASSGEANVAAGRQNFAPDGAHEENAYLLFGNTVAESPLYSKFRFEVELKWVGHIGMCIMDEFDYRVACGGSHPAMIQENFKRACSVWTNDEDLGGQLNRDTHFEFTVDSKAKTITARNIKSGQIVVRGYDRNELTNELTNIGRPRLSFIASFRGTTFTIVNQSWIE